MNHAALLAACKQNGLEVGLAVAPNTGLHLIELFHHDLDELLILGVQPGYSGQSLIASTLDKAREAAQHFSNMTIGFDGGVSPTTAAEILTTGVKRLYTASALFDTEHPKETLKKFQTLIQSPS
jgi:ribulose-phosphate 3-epimerase